jgi:CheY-like chemotaxis protein
VEATPRLEDPSGSDLTASPRLRLSDLQWRAATEVISLEFAQLRRQLSESSGRHVRKRDGFLEKSDLVFVAENSLESQKRVLEVEDDPDIREMVSGLLLSEGYEVVSAVHGQDAIEKMEGGFSPDVILLDLMMPVLNGFDVLRVLHRTPRWSSIPVVIVSAKEGYDAADLGTAAIIHKPFDPDVLLNTLRRLLSRAPARIPQ